jgi:hypothetical protein
LGKDWKPNCQYFATILLMDNKRNRMYQWNFQCLQGVTEFDRDILKEIHQIFLEGFGLPAGWSLDGIKNRLQKSTLLGLLSDGRENDFLICPDFPGRGATRERPYKNAAL